MTTMSHRAMTQVVCRIFIKASPQAVWDAICPALKVDAAGPNASVWPGQVYFELRDTRTGYTAVTVSCETVRAPAMPEPGHGGTHDWGRLLGDLKIVLEAEGREHQRTGPARSSPPRPLWLRPTLLPQVEALSGGRLSPDRPAPALPGGAVRMWRDRSHAVPGEREPRAAPGERKPAASQRTERSDGDGDSGNRGTGIRGVIQGAGNVTLPWGRRLRCA